jgi:hypothetical protein
MLSKGKTRYVICAITLLAGTFASLCGGWFDGS